MTTEVLQSVEVNSRARIVRFEHDSEARISRIRDYTGRQWCYDYDDLGDLVAFTTPATTRYPEGLRERYQYSTAYQMGESQHNMVQLFDTADRLYIENEYGVERGLLSFNRIIRQREGAGERFFFYEDVSLKTGLPAAGSEMEEELPAHQTVMVHRNGHPEHYICNRFGNLIAREEDSWTAGIWRRLVTHYGYNRDGALIGEVSPEGRITQYLYGRDFFLQSHGLTDLSEEELLQQNSLTWQKRQTFGNLLAVIHRARRSSVYTTLQFPSPFPSLDFVHPDDIITKFEYEAVYQGLSSVSDPRHTKSPWPGALADNSVNNPRYDETLTRLHYRSAGRLLDRIIYPMCTRDGQAELTNISERFFNYDARGRLTEYIDRRGTRSTLEYHSVLANPLAPGASKEGYLRRQVMDPREPQSNPDGLNLEIRLGVNDVGVSAEIITPKKQRIALEIDEINRVTKATRTLRPGMTYAVHYTYCRNMRLEEKRRDLKDENGVTLWEETEVEFFEYDENDNVTCWRRGGPDFSKHLITRYEYDDGDLRVGTILPRGNRVRIDYDERRLPRRIVRGAGSQEATEVTVAYDGDGLLVERSDGRNLKTELAYDAFGRVTETRDYDDGGKVFRLVRQDHDKADNLIIERVFVPVGEGFNLLFHTEYVFNELNWQIETRVRRFEEPIPYTQNDVLREDDGVPLNQAVQLLYFYDEAGLLVRLEEQGKRLLADGSLASAPSVLTTEIDYNAVGWPIWEKDPLGNETETHYDSHGLVSRVDVRERVAESSTGEYVFTTLYEYDSLDRLKAVIDSLGNTTSLYYDSRDDVVRIEDRLGNVVRYEYDVYGRQVAERIEMTDTGLGGGLRPPGSDIVTENVFDENDNLVGIIDAKGASTVQDYDALDRPIELRYADGTVRSFRYDGNDNIIWEKDGNGLIQRRRFDPLDNPLRTDIDLSELQPGIAIGGATFEAFEHDALGRQTRATNDWCDVLFRFDSLGRVFEEVTLFHDLGRQFVLKRRYDDFDFLARLTYPNGRVVAYEADSLNRIVRVRNVTYGVGYPGDDSLPADRLLVENQYSGSRIRRKQFGGVAKTEYAYDGAARVIQITHTDGQNNSILSMLQLYDGAGNMRLKYEYGPSQPYAERYLYDSRYQLTHWKPLALAGPVDVAALGPAKSMPAARATLTGQDQIDALLGSIEQVPAEFTFDYDKLGNRLEERRPGEQAILYAVNNLNQYLKRGATSYSYNSNGNLSEAQTSTGTRRYVYDHRNQPVRISEGGVSVDYRYDAFGRRIYEGDGTLETYRLFDEDNEIEEWEYEGPGGQAKLVAQYTNESDTDDRFHLASAGSDFVFFRDLVGSTRILLPIASTGPQGPQPQLFRYSPFGRLEVGPSSSSTSFMFIGRAHLDVIEEYDARARSYNTELGRFLQRDVVPGLKPNEYVYSSNAPLTRSDPEGDDDKVKVPAGYYRHQSGLILRKGETPEDYYRRQNAYKQSWAYARQQFLDREVPKLYQSLKPWIPISKGVLSTVVLVTPLGIWGIGSTLAIGSS